MFVGHAAVALAARPRLPGRSLGLLLAGAYLIDLVWPILLLLGVESVLVRPGDTAFTPLEFVHYPWSHSLLAAAAWGLLFAAAALRGLRPAREFAWLFGLVVSHWLLDFLSHRPDLPLLPGASARYGLGLWRSVPATLVVEGAFFALALALYLRATKPLDRTGGVALWSLAALLAAIWASGPFSPPPPGEKAIAVVGLALWLIPLWGHWADRHRAPREPGPAGAP